ncbi:MAG: hypothetical protein AAB737_00065, partial [Patescibacteria group bacterium]
MTRRKKTILQRIPLGVKLLIGLIILSFVIAMMGKSSAPVETGLWIFTIILVVSAVVLILVALFVSYRKKGEQKRARDERVQEVDTNADKAHTPPPTAPPAPAGGHTSKSGGLLRFSFNLLVLGLVCLVLWFFGTLVYRYIGLGEAPALRTQNSGFVAQSPRIRPSPPTWTSVSAPSTGWLVVSVLPGPTLSPCDQAPRQVRCAAAAP